MYLSVFELISIDCSNRSLDGLIFRMLGAYFDSLLGVLIPALWVPLEFAVIECTLVHHSGTSGRVIVYEY